MKILVLGGDGYLGWPTASLPVGLSSDGMPLALQLSRPLPEPPLIAGALWCEAAFRRAQFGGSA